MTRWLDPVVAALDDAASPCPIFFRDDDAGWDDVALGALLDVFERHDVPVDVAVIPAALDAVLARGLCERARSARVRLHQHGYAHRNHEVEGRKCEFGPSRSRVEVARDVAAGRLRLADTLGRDVDPVFTPPWNRCSADTAAALFDQGIRILSRDSSATAFELPGLAEVPVTVDWFGHRKGARWTRPQLAERLATCVRGGGPVGVMLHHAVTDDAERAAIDELVALVARHPRAENVTIDAVATAPAGSGVRIP